MEFGEKICKLKAEDTHVLFSCEGARDTEDRMFVVDLRASMHMLSTKDVSSDKMVTSRRSRNPITVLTATGTVRTSVVHDLDLFVTMQLLDETPAVLLLHQLFSKHGYSHEWKTAKLHTWPKMGRQFLVQWITQYFSLLRLSFSFQQLFVFNIEMNGSV